VPAALSTLALLALGCTDSTGGTGTPSLPQLGDPIPGLTDDELAAFERGRILFSKRFTPEEGLGPFYNATSCASCHSTPVPGGSSELYRNFYLALLGPVGLQVPPAELPSPVVPNFGTGIHSTADFDLEGGRFPIPWQTPSILTVSQRNSLPTFGVGLFEAISDATILSNADPDDADADGISGRVNYDRGAIGRLGVKAQSNNIELFTRSPLMNQMGITSDPFEGEGATASLMMLQVSADPNDPTVDADSVPDPEISREDLGDLIAFARFLAPPAKLPFDEAAQRGDTLLDSIGCFKCHIPSLPSSRGDVHAYTDLLLHEMGSELADGMSFGIPQPSTISDITSAYEFRTQPLWGVSLSGPWLHDGRAATLEDAILMHGGEAQASRDAFEALTRDEKDDILSCLERL
jgi:CxxC motif-containing protein (DUF1111 family)